METKERRVEDGLSELKRRLRTACGRTTGHGMSCEPGMKCSACAEKDNAAAEVERLQAENELLKQVEKNLAELHNIALAEIEALKKHAISLPADVHKVEIHVKGGLMIDAWRCGVAKDDPEPWNAVWMNSSVKNDVPEHLRFVFRGPAAAAVIQLALDARRKQ